jgi:hypothetical protein
MLVASEVVATLLAASHDRRRPSHNGGFSEAVRRKYGANLAAPDLEDRRSLAGKANPHGGDGVPWPANFSLARRFVPGRVPVAQSAGGAALDRPWLFVRRRRGAAERVGSGASGAAAVAGRTQSRRRARPCDVGARRNRRRFDKSGRPVVQTEENAQNACSILHLRDDFSEIR